MKLNTIGSHLLIVPVLALVGLLIVGGLAITTLEQRVMQGREDRVVAVMDLALGLIDHYQSQVASGDLSDEDAQRLARDAIRSLRYDTIEYFWINDMGQPYPRMIMHPTVPSLDGEILDGRNFYYATLARDLDGRTTERLDNENLFVAFVDVVNRFGEGFVEYQWPRPLAGGGVTDERFTKLSFVTYDPEWEWLIGTGIYVDDVADITWGLALRFALVVAVLILALIGATYYVRRWVLSHLGGDVHDTVSIVNQVAEGDFTVQIPLRAGDKTSLLAAISRMTAQLRDLVSNLQSLSGTLLEQATSLAQSSEETRTIMASVHDETAQAATAVHQMSATTQEVATNAASAAQTTKGAETRVTEGHDSVEKTIRAIETLHGNVSELSEVLSRLAKDGEEIGQVTAEIGGIAEQTNLLALNAAIEAARAGEQGRGFAVVADEVRTLASRTQTSTQEISDKIGRVQDGSNQAVETINRGQEQAAATIEQANQSGQTLVAIRQSMEELTDINTQLASAAEQMATVANDVNRNMDSIAQSVEQTTESTTQISETSQSLQTMADELEQQLKRFRI
ncbi:methyl-accepting chemotaxis protein [Natronospirillum operosum]|uniref:Methyl-accepting chemotaxis protein n=1 Tax=Natronospirillum operosum TaxID=2759953 RepID=A0A4Z0W5H2_9GAMM|nr:methyl-accepting chemotaxis protein [Natronospirillum operosum]TGG91139.1 methyl-accepting chemotaxis protein [Natronospirillum operosum]